MHQWSRIICGQSCCRVRGTARACVILWIHPRIHIVKRFQHESSRSPHPPPVLPLVLHHTTPHARRPGHRSSLVPITALHQSPRRPEQTPTCQRLPPSPPSPPHLHLPFQPPSNRQPWPSSAMAKRTSTSSSSSSNWTAMKASCYTVNAASMALQGFHYSTTPAAGVEWRS